MCFKKNRGEDDDDDDDEKEEIATVSIMMLSLEHWRGSIRTKGEQEEEGDIGDCRCDDGS